MTVQELAVAAGLLSGAFAGLLTGVSSYLVARNTIKGAARKDRLDELEKIIAAQSKRMDNQDEEICKQAEKISELKEDVRRYRNWAEALVRQVSALGKRPISIDEANGGAPGVPPQRRGFDI